MTTFSQLVDSMVSETRRPDKVSEISRYLKQTIRELHFDSQANAVLFFQSNFKELLLTANVEDGFGWDIPKPQVFQKLHVVKLLNVWDCGEQVYSTPTVPGRHLHTLAHYHYQVGDQFVFANYGGLNAQIAVGYYEYPRGLAYQPSATRLVTWNEDLEIFEYDPSLTTPEERAAALEAATNWMLTRWEDIIAEGVRAKVFKSVSDTERARTAYSMYMSLRQGMWTSEQSQVQEVR